MKDIFIDFCQLLNMVKIHGVVTKSVVSVRLATDMENSCIINVKNEHNHEPDERKASEDATARPSKIIGKQLQTMSKTNLKQDDIKNVSKAIYRERRKRHPTLP